jgi:DNA/RNA endonuclease YhcR with UshA esterase domain
VAAAPTRTALARSLGQLAAADKGQLVAVRGKIVAVLPFSKGMRYRLDDGTGRIILLLWQEMLDQAPDLARLPKGAQVSVTGVVDVFNGELEVTPKSGADVRVLP